MIDPETTYRTVRQEILDQKKCQFNLFSACITINAAVLAYAATTSVSPLVYIAPIVLNVLAVVIILDKAVSIQRMVGYLQLMETWPERTWTWEYHLSKFRSKKGKRHETESFRRHSYIVTVASFLSVLNLLSAWLYFRGPSATILKASDEFERIRGFYHGVNWVVLALVAGGALLTLHRWRQLMAGKFTGGAIKKRWMAAIEQAEKDLLIAAIEQAEKDLLISDNKRPVSGTTTDVAPRTSPSPAVST